MTIKEVGVNREEDRGADVRTTVMKSSQRVIDNGPYYIPRNMEVNTKDPIGMGELR